MIRFRPWQLLSQQFGRSHLRDGLELPEQGQPPMCGLTSKWSCRFARAPRMSDMFGVVRRPRAPQLICGRYAPLADANLRRHPMATSRPVILAVAIAATACSKGAAPQAANGDPPPTAATQGAATSAEQETAAIRAMDARFDTLIASRDTSGLVAMYAPDAIVMPMEFPTATDAVAIRRIWVAALSLPRLDMRFTPMRIDVAVSGELAVSAGTFTFNFESPKGPVRDVYQSLQGYRKVDGAWKVAYHIWSKLAKPGS